MSSLSIIIVNYRSGKLLPACLESLIHSGIEEEFEILIVNNDAPGDLVSLNTRQWPNTRVLQNGSNLGLAAAVNRAYEEARGQFLLLLNPDVQVLPKAVSILLDTLRKEAQAGIVVPKLQYPDGRLQLSCRRFYNYRALLFRRGPWKAAFARHPEVRRHLMEDWDHATLTSIDWALGAAMLIRREAAQKTKLLDERFFLYFEDVDLCLGMHQRGWSVLYDPASCMIHHHQRDSANFFSWRAKQRHCWSLAQFLFKHRFLIGVPK